MTTDNEVEEGAKRHASSVSGEPGFLSIDAGSVELKSIIDVPARHVRVPPGSVAEIRRAKRAKALSAPRAVVENEKAQTIREQLIACGVIKPVEVFQARARELDAELSRAEEARTKKKVDAGEARPTREAKDNRINDGEGENGKSKRSLPKERRLFPSEMSKAEKNKIARARLKARQIAHENGLDANRYFFCMVCGERYMGSEQDAHWKEKHPEKFHKFKIKRGYSFSHGLVGRAGWVQVFQGGLPGLGKRR